MKTFKQYLLTESNRAYEKMFTDIFDVYDKIDDSKKNFIKREQLRDAVKANIKWAKSILKKNDRIVWYLRINKMIILHSMKDFDPEFKKIFLKNKNKLKKKGVRENLHNLMNGAEVRIRLQHFFSLNIREINDYVFKKESATEVFGLFLNLEQKWREENKGLGTTVTRPIWLNLPGKWAWYEVPNGDEEEKKTMGHCATGSTVRGKCYVLSLREEIKKGKRKGFQPHVTFIFYPHDGSLGEMKGKGNKKPTEKYHKMIVALLKDKRIKKIFGGGHASDQNFSLKDLDKKLYNDLAKKRPDMIKTAGTRLEIALQNDDIDTIEKITKDAGYAKWNNHRLDLKKGKWENLIDVPDGHYYTASDMSVEKDEKKRILKHREEDLITWANEKWEGWEKDYPDIYSFIEDETEIDDKLDEALRKIYAERENDFRNGMFEFYINESDGGAGAVWYSNEVSQFSHNELDVWFSHGFEYNHLNQQVKASIDMQDFVDMIKSNRPDASEEEFLNILENLDISTYFDIDNNSGEEIFELEKNEEEEIIDGVLKKLSIRRHKRHKRHKDDPRQMKFKGFLERYVNI